MTVYKGHSTKQYLKLDALGSDVFEVKELKSNPDNLEVSLSTYDVDTKTGTAQIKFGATLGVDDVPDDVLPINTSIKTEITALNGIENPDKTNVKESNPVTPISVTGPNATMYGLRFEGQRKTKLYFPNPGTGSRKSTVSMWFKHTKSNDFYALFSQGQDSNNDGFFTRFRIENGKLRVETAQAAGVQQVSMVTPSVIPEERWQHLVVSFDSDSAMIMYLNGQEVGRRALESTGKYPWEAGRDTNIGCLGKNASGDDIQFYEGYLSDVFYVEGQDLPPETFGEDFEGKWGPLDSSKVIENIGSVDETEFPPNLYDGSQVWSDNYVGEQTIFPPSQAFDGDIDTGFAFATSGGNGMSGTFNFSDITGLTSLRVRVLTGYATTDNGHFKVNGIDIQDQITTSRSWITIPDDKLVSIEMGKGSAGSTTFDPNLSAVEVNGRILVDAASFGTNGFFLPFNPDNPSGSSAGLATKYDVKVSNEFDINNANFTYDAAAPFASNVPLGEKASGDATTGYRTLFYKLDAPGRPWFVRYAGFFDADTNIYSSNDGNSWTHAKAGKMPAPGDTSLQGDTAAIYWAWVLHPNAGAPPNYGPDVTDVVVFSAIGYDASGNDNHFTDKNFQLQPATLYSKDITYKGDYFAGSKEEIFNGDPTFTKLVVSQTDGSAFIKWTGTLENVTSLSVFTERNGYVEVVGNLGTIQQSYTLGGSSVEVAITPGNLAAVGTTITSISTHWVAYPDQVYMYSIKVNGSLLVDAEDAGIDAVKDTPMLNYAVLETGANGNLEATGSSSITYLGEAGTDYYYEEDGVGKVHAGGGAFTSTSGKTYNFGQQPFASKYNNDQIWSTTSNLRTAPKNAFDGDMSTTDNCGVNRTSSITFVEPLSGCTKIEFHIRELSSGDPDNIDENKFRYSAKTSDGDKSIEDVVPYEGWHVIYEGPAVTMTGFENEVKNYGGNLQGIRVNGEILVDTDSALGKAVGNELFQTWAEWNDYVTLFADNPEHVAKFEAIKAALESYEGDLRQYRAQLLTRLVTSGFTLHEIDSMDLINIEDAAEWQVNTGYEDGALVTYNNEYWFALSSSYNNSPDDNDPEDWVSLTP